MTKHYIMIGMPVGGVRTPPLLRDHLRALGVACEVTTVEVTPEALADFMIDVRADASVDGLMVTMPHKKAIIPFLDGLSDTAARSESVNAVKRSSAGALLGGQFDGTALVRALLAADAAPRTARVLLAGLGGAGTAIAQALAGYGCRQLDIHDVDGARLAAVIGTLGNDASAVTPPFAARYDILVNATPLGMTPGDPSPFDAEVVAKAHWVADIVADPSHTRLADLTRDAGTRLVTGRQMVEQQIDPIAQWLLSPEIAQTAAF